MLFDGSVVTIPIAFAAGVVTFFASCLVPLIPTYIAYLTGVAAQTKSQRKWSIAWHGLLFAIGFGVSFVVLGLLLNRFAVFINPYRGILERAFGVVFVLLGLLMVGIAPVKKLSQNFELHWPGWTQKSVWLSSFLLGVGFALGWSPCIGPVLAVILYWATIQESFQTATWLLSSYAVGITLPFVILAIFFDAVRPYIKIGSKFGRWLYLIAGGLLVVMGLLMVLGMWQAIAARLLFLTHWFAV